MSKAESNKIDSLRHAEYYGMQATFDRLYSESKEGKAFEDLTSVILSRENILLAYRNLKSNSGSNTPGTDGLTIKDVQRLTPDEVVAKIRFIAKESPHGYRPKPVRRKEIPKPDGRMRPLGIPCIWDRLLQQCVKQVMEPICEAKFSNNSYGFRPLRSAENAVSVLERRLQLDKLYYVIEFDIKGFFDNVDHSKLIKQIWSIGIHDNHLIYLIRQMLKAPIKMENGSVTIPTKGTPQGGILSPLLANIVLNELDRWVEGQWLDHPLAYNHEAMKGRDQIRRVRGYRKMRQTNLKEMQIVRYADDFRILCRTEPDAERIKAAVTQWLTERLRLEISEEKTRIVNARRQYTDFLGIKIKLYPKGSKDNQKWVVKSHMSDKALENATNKLIAQAKRVASPRDHTTVLEEVNRYNRMVLGIQNYYRMATLISEDCGTIQWRISRIIHNRLSKQKGKGLSRTGRQLTEFEKTRYGKSEQLIYVKGTDEPLYPIGYIKAMYPADKKVSSNVYTVEGRVGIHDNLKVNTSLMLDLMRNPEKGLRLEATDNCLSLFAAQNGKCAITGKEFTRRDEIKCHVKNMRKSWATYRYENLILVLPEVHELIQATADDKISELLDKLKLNKEQLDKVNALREEAGLAIIALDSNAM